MKLRQIFCCLALVTTVLATSALVPKTETTAHYMRVLNVERNDSSLRVALRLLHQPKYWVQIPASVRLINVADTTMQFKAIGHENLPLDTKIAMPASGYHDGVLIFEKVPQSVKVVDLVEDSSTDLTSNVLGIHLDEAETRVRPKMHSITDILNAASPPQEQPWNGLDPERYADLSFYDRNGKTHLRGRIIDYSPRYEVGNVSITSRNNFIDFEKVSVADIDSQGNFELTLPVAYPQWSYLEIGSELHQVCLIPGDTLQVVTCMAMKQNSQFDLEPEYFGFEGTLDDGVAVNVLADSIFNHYDLRSIFAKYRVAPNDSMLSNTYKANLQLCQMLDRVEAELPSMLGTLPVTPIVKDLLSAYVISEICCQMEDLEMRYNGEKGPGFRYNDEGTLAYEEGVNIDIATLLTPRLRHKDMIYNNPLLISNGYFLMNRWQFNSLFRPVVHASNGMEPMKEMPIVARYVANIPALYAASNARLDSLGVGNCFAAQLVCCHSLFHRLNDDVELTSDDLNKRSNLVVHLLKNMDNEALSKLLFTEHNYVVKTVAISEHKFDNNLDPALEIYNSPEGQVLKELIAPYRGNVIFLDFWGLGCGPCMSGMKRHRQFLDSLANQPFKILYIANAAKNIEGCKRWLQKEAIKGEHIFISDDNWKRMEALFNFTGIPRGVLIGKDGRIIKNGHEFYLEDVLLQKALQE